MTKSGDRGYKRSWKNLLINKRYQLRFTLFMVGLSALLMTGLGVWVMWVANETTAVSITSVRGDACPRLPAVESMAAGAGSADGELHVARPSMKLDEPGGSVAAGSAAAGSDAASGDGEPRRANVQIDESSMTLTPTLPPDFVDRVAAHWACELRQAATFDRLERGRLHILWAMIATGVALVIGLALYGIKMTHRVAGPLFKVSLYLTKMRDGRFDKVYNLRKGDQLVDFYDQFKAAHGGIVAMQQDDLARIAQVIAAADAAGLGQHPAVAELRELSARKEKSIE
ncbi:MAG TPA: hypothetical protein VHW23_34345 [Kofleriaceae bacterium]|nr:hypothetical protein [Kofleriaceae bacterium]